MLHCGNTDIKIWGTLTHPTEITTSHLTSSCLSSRVTSHLSTVTEHIAHASETARHII